MLCLILGYTFTDPSEVTSEKSAKSNMQSSCCVNEGAASYIYCLVHIHSSVWRYHHHQERNERKPAQVVVRMFQLSLLSPMGGPVTQFNILLQQLPPKVTPTPTVVWLVWVPVGLSRGSDSQSLPCFQVCLVTKI